MSSSIHHGNPGSYKTFACVYRYAIPALEKGRVIVTNIRGFDSLEKIKKIFPEVEFPESAQIINIDTASKESRMMMAQWYHWAPVGALVLIDECQFIYPKKMKVEILEHFNHESFNSKHFQIELVTDQEGNTVSRPIEFFQAIDMQRHYNWDLYLTSTNITKIHTEIKESTETSYYHKNTSGLLPWKDSTWKETLHDPTTNGRLDSHKIGTPKNYKADPRFYGCYKSTITGDYKRELTRDSILKDKRVQFYSFLAILSLGTFLYLLQVKLSDPAFSKVSTKTATKNIGFSTVQGNNKKRVTTDLDSSDFFDGENNAPVHQSYVEKTIDELDIYLVSKSDITSHFLFKFDNLWKRLSVIEVVQYGYSVIIKSDHAILTLKTESRVVNKPPLGSCRGSYFSASSFSFVDCFSVKVEQVVYQGTNALGSAVQEGLVF